MKPISIRNRPFSAPPVACHDEIGSDLHVVGGSSIVKIHANGSHTHMHTHTLVAGEDNDDIAAGEGNDTTVAAADDGKEGEERKKASIVVDVIIEAIFIVGKTLCTCTFIQSLTEV